MANMNSRDGDNTRDGRDGRDGRNSGDLKAAVMADSKPDLGSGSIFFIGTATVILRYAGFTILTDPNFLHKGGQVPLGYGLHTTRQTNPAINLEDLPPLDLIILSHLHGDHFDPLVERNLAKDIPIVTTPHAATKLRGKGFQITHPLNTWQSFETTKNGVRLCITAMPGQHAPGLLSAALPPVMGSMLEFEILDGGNDSSNNSSNYGGNNGKKTLHLYITGDTLLHQSLQEIPHRYPQIDLALLHLGGTRLFGLMLTMDARQGVEAIKIIAPDTAIPIHYNDYPVFKSSLDEFKVHVKAAGLEKQVKYLTHGDTYNFEVPASRWQ